MLLLLATCLWCAADSAAGNALHAVFCRRSAVVAEHRASNWGKESLRYRYVK